MAGATPVTDAANVNQLGDGGTDGATIGSATSPVSFYGEPPVAQRASAVVHYASVVSATSYMSVTSNLCAFAAEVANTLVGLGIWI